MRRLAVAALAIASTFSMASSCAPPKPPLTQDSATPSVAASPSTVDPSPSPSLETPSSAPPSAQTRPTTGGPKTTPGGPTDTDLTAALITPADLPGFNVAADSDDGSRSGCAALDSEYTAGASAKAGIFMSKGAAGPFVREQLRQMSVANASNAVAQLRSTTSTCASFTAPHPLYESVDITVVSLSQPSRGAESTALRITMKTKKYGATFLQNLVVVRHGGTLMMVSHLSITTIDNSLITNAATIAYNRFASRW